MISRPIDCVANAAMRFVSGKMFRSPVPINMISGENAMAGASSYNVSVSAPRTDQSRTMSFGATITFPVSHSSPIRTRPLSHAWITFDWLVSLFRCKAVFTVGLGDVIIVAGENRVAM